jgi:acyl-coenzyme A thioesterase PaaI-like protein
VELSLDEHAEAHIVRELGFAISRSGTRSGDDLGGSAAIVPEMFVPGTRTLRTSIIATWTDMVSGLLVAAEITPRVPVTLELDVHLYRPPDDLHSLHVDGRMLKAGRTVMAVAVDISGDDGEPVGRGAASFMAAPDARRTLPPAADVVAATMVGRRSLRVPFAERAGCERREAGVAVLPRRDDGLNASNSVNGGLIALAVEEAVLSTAPGATLSSLAMRYLRPVREGPAVASAEVVDGLGWVEVRDVGVDDRLAVVATTRMFAPSR